VADVPQAPFDAGIVVTYAEYVVESYVGAGPNDVSHDQFVGVVDDVLITKFPLLLEPVVYNTSVADLSDFTIAFELEVGTAGKVIAVILQLYVLVPHEFVKFICVTLYVVLGVRPLKVNVGYVNDGTEATPFTIHDTEVAPVPPARVIVKEDSVTVPLPVAPLRGIVHPFTPLGHVVDVTAVGIGIAGVVTVY